MSYKINPLRYLTKIPKIWIFLLLVQIAIPVAINNPYYIKIFVMFYIYIIFAMSWDLLGGYLGIVSFGHALFFGVAAYTTALLNVRLNWPPIINFPLSILCALVMSLIVAKPSIRLKGHYLTLVTLAFPIIVTNVFFAFPGFFGADLGIPGISRLSYSRVVDFYIAFIATWVIYFILKRIISSDIGLILRAIQSNEVAPVSCGIDIAKVKLQMFLVSGMFAGVAGFLYAHVIKIVGPESLGMGLSVEAVVICVIGGIGTLSGAVFGAVVVTFINEFLRIIEEYRFLIYYLLILLIVLFFPKGLKFYIDKLLSFTGKRLRGKGFGL